MLPNRPSLCREVATKRLSPTVFALVGNPGAKHVRMPGLRRLGFRGIGFRSKP